VTERSLKTFQGKQQEHFKWASLWLAGQNLYNLTNSTSHVTRSSAAVSYRVGKVLRVCIHRPVVVVPQLITLQSELGGGVSVTCVSCAVPLGCCHRCDVSCGHGDYHRWFSLVTCDSWLDCGDDLTMPYRHCRDVYRLSYHHHHSLPLHPL